MEKIEFNKIRKSPITKLAFGSLIAQIISIVVSPITTRIYTAEQLGIYTLLLTVVTLFGPILSAKMDMAIVTEKNDRNMYAAIVLSTIINIILSVITTIIYTIYIIITNQFSDEFIWYIFIIFICLILTGFSNILSSYNNRNKDYDIISKVYVIRTLIQNFGLVIFGIMKFSITGMLLSQAIGSFVGLGKQSEKLWPNLNQIKQITKEDIKAVLRNNYKLITYTTPATLCNSASYSLINFFITALYGSTVFGYYSISYRILGLPLHIISTNVAKVFFERANTEINTKGSFSEIFKRTSLLIAGIAIPMVLILIFFAPILCQIVYGKDWISAGRFVQILVFMFGIRMIVSTISPGLIIAKKQAAEMKMQIALLMASIFTYAVCKFFKLNIYIFLIIITILYSIIYLIIYVFIYKISRKEVIKNEN